MHEVHEAPYCVLRVIFRAIMWSQILTVTQHSTSMGKDNNLGLYKFCLIKNGPAPIVKKGIYKLIITLLLKFI